MQFGISFSKENGIDTNMSYSIEVNMEIIKKCWKHYMYDSIKYNQKEKGKIGFV